MAMSLLKNARAARLLSLGRAATAYSISSAEYRGTYNTYIHGLVRWFASQPENSEKESRSGPETQRPSARSPENKSDSANRSNISSQIDDHLQKLLKEHQMHGPGFIVEQSLEDHLAPWLRFLLTMFGSWVQRWSSDFIKARIETEFDVSEWLEGAKDAYWTVHSLMAKDDYTALNDMVSSKLLTAMEGTAEDYRKSGLAWRSEIDPEEPIGAQINGISFMNREGILKYDETAAAQRAGTEEVAHEGAWLKASPHPENLDGKWLVITVQYRTTNKLVITRADSGEVIAKLIDRRPHTWKFASGPLPKELPVKRLESSWWLLAI